MSAIEQTPAQKSGPSLVVQVGILLLMTVAAIGMGWLSGGYLYGEAKPVEQAAAEQAKPHAAKEGSTDTGATEGAGTLVQLPAITSNLAAPDSMWVRLELSLVLDAPQPPDLAERVHQDLLAFVRTLRIHQVQGASALRHLKTDLDERAAIRSDGHVKEVLIRTLLFE